MGKSDTKVRMKFKEVFVTHKNESLAYVFPFMHRVSVPEPP